MILRGIPFFRVSIPCVLVFLCLVGCAQPGRTYPNGILAASVTFMSPEELERYGAGIDQEIGRVERGGAVPVGVTREIYLEDLRAKREDITTRLMMIEHFRQKDEFDDRYPAS
jgi:hypothetical protein